MRRKRIKKRGREEYNFLGSESSLFCSHLGGNFLYSLPINMVALCNFCHDDNNSNRAWTHAPATTDISSQHMKWMGVVNENVYVTPPRTSLTTSVTSRLARDGGGGPGDSPIVFRSQGYLFANVQSYLRNGQNSKDKWFSPNLGLKCSASFPLTLEIFRRRC